MRLGGSGRRERVLQGFLDGACVGLQHAETLVVGLLGVVAGEIDQLALVSALRDGDVDACGSSALARELLAQQLLPVLRGLRSHRDVDVARHIGLGQIELLDQGGEEFAGVEFGGRRGSVAGDECIAPRGSRQTPAGPPRKIPGGPGLFRRACETGSRPASGSRSDSRRRRRRRLRRRRCAASPAVARRWRSGRDSWRRARTPALRRLPPCARAEI